MPGDRRPPNSAEIAELYDSFVRMCSIGLSSSDTETGTISLANAALCNMLGYNEDEVVGETFLKFTHPDERDSAWQTFCQAVETRQSFTATNRLLRRDGSVIVARSNVAFVEVTHGNGLMTIAATEDISEHRQREQELLASKQKLQQLADAMPQVVWIASAEGRLIYTNRRGIELFGNAAMDDPARLLHPNDRRITKLQWDKSYRARTIFEVELRLQSLDDDYRWYLVRGVPVFASDSSIDCWYGTATDIHQLKATESALREQRERFWQSQKMEAIGRLAGGIAHDFNNLLTIVLGECEMMLKTEPQVESLERSLVAVREAGLRASELTKQLLTFGRRDRAKFDVLDLNHQVTQVSNLLNRMAGDAIVIRHDLSSLIPWVRTDRTHFEQVLFNLVGNAVDAMPNGGLIQIQTEVLTDSELSASDAKRFPQGAVRMAVADSGIGFDPQFAEQIFEPFFTTKEVGRGSGLGLAVVHGIVEQLGGQVSAESNSQGSTFSVVLPLSKKQDSISI